MMTFTKVFVTLSEETAKQWVEKFNRILQSYNDYIDSVQDDMEYYPSKFYTVMEINNANYRAIEQR